MKVTVLIDAIVHQTTALIAQLATSAGVRAPLSHLANQVFLEITNELERQGVGRKVIADMFGLALRSYQEKVQRLSESATQRGTTLWEAVHGYLVEKGPTTRADILRRFRYDNERTVKGILHDLTESGLASRSGRGPSTVFRAATDEEIGLGSGTDPSQVSANMVWVAVYRNAPVSADELSEAVSLDAGQIRAALERLVAEGRISQQADGRYTSQSCALEIGDPAGWEAAVYDHVSAVFGALARKLQVGAQRAEQGDRTGGSTLAFDIWDTHPHRDQVYSLLEEVRALTFPLWERVREHNRMASRPADASKVTFYFGQSVVSEREEDE